LIAVTFGAQLSSVSDYKLAAFGLSLRTVSPPLGPIIVGSY
jgi:hypothetical protein